MKSNPVRSSRTWQFAIACLAFSTAALVGCDRRDGPAATSTTSPSMPASAASR